MFPIIENQKQAAESAFIYKTISDPEVIGSTFVEIIVPQGKIFIVGCVYGPPNQYSALFLEKLNEILTIIIKTINIFMSWEILI